MKIMIKIPKKFEKHFNEDRFEDSLLRISSDTRHCFENRMSGNYEIELLDMLIKVFMKAEVYKYERPQKN